MILQIHKSKKAKIYKNKAGKWNNLLHDKYMIVDNRIAIIGGRNIGDEYFAPDDFDGKKTNDREVMIISKNIEKDKQHTSAVYQIKLYFDSVWNHKFSKSTIEKLSVNQKTKAKKKSKMLQDNIDKYIDEIIDSDINLYEYQGDGSIHGKSYIFDDRISLIGSFNMDARSCFLSTETMVVIDSKEFASILKENIQDLLDESLIAEEKYSYINNPSVIPKSVPIYKQIILNVLHLLTYFFDYLI